MKIDKDNYLGLIVSNLILLKDAFANEEISHMLYDGDEEDKIYELQNLIDYLQTNEKE